MSINQRRTALIPEFTKKSWLAALLVWLIVMLVLPKFMGIGNIYLVSVTMVWSIIALGFNLLWGYTGILSFGHSLFYGFGAYSFALLVIGGIPIGLSIIIAAIISSLAALVTALILLRLRGMFLALGVMAFSQMVWALNLRLHFTHGPDGLHVPVSPVFLSQINCYYLILGIFVVSLIILRIIVNSPFGLTLKAIRDQQLRVEFLAINVFLYKLASFTISGFFVGLGGALITLLVRGAFPDAFFWSVAGNIVMVCLVGGLNSFLGPVVGAVAFELVDGLVMRFTVYWQVVLGTILIIVVIFFREGITGFIVDLMRKRTQRNDST